MKANPWKFGIVALAMPQLFLTGCKDEEQTKKIQELEEQAVELDAELQQVRTDLNQTKQDRDKFRSEVDQVRRDLQNSKNLAENLQRQLDSMRKAEQRQREIASQQASRNPAEEARATVQQKFDAVWQISGDQKSIHGIVAEADGKTWFYFPASGLATSGRLSVKDSAGNAVTKLGEFQVAADANLARLEIKQDVPSRITIQSQSALGENPMLLAITPGDDGKLQMLDCSAGNVSAGELELSLSGPAASGGYPVFSAETGSFVCITTPLTDSAAGPWPATDAVDTGLLKVPRLDRAVEWKPAAINNLLVERRKIDELNRSTRLLTAVAALSVSSKGFSFDTTVGGGSLTAKQVLDEQKSAPGVADLIKLNENLSAQKLRVSENDLNKQISGIFGQFASAGQRGLNEAKTIKPSPPNRTDFENALKWNEEALKRLNEKLTVLGRN